MDDAIGPIPAETQVKNYYTNCLVVFAVVGCIGGGGFVFTFLKALRHSWPPIKNADVLYQDCQKLMERYPEEIREEQWTQSIQVLHPRRVELMSKQALVIVVSYGGVNGVAWGYLVVNDPDEAKQWAKWNGSNGQVSIINYPHIFKIQ